MFPLNTAGILIMSRAYKFHTAVFFNDKFWTTSSDISALHKCSVFSVYRGGTVFQDTRRMHVEEYEERKAMIRNMGKYYERWQIPSKEYRSKLRNCIPSDDEDDDVEQTTSQSRTDLLTNIMPTDDEDDGPSTSITTQSPPCSECDKERKRWKSVIDCKKCSKCQLKEDDNESDTALDLEEVLNETLETNNIMAMDKESTEKLQSTDSEEDKVTDK